ncbi:MAG: hypothetical protein ACM3SY_02080 [Candidatus Omnitrophota bacterium]
MIETVEINWLLLIGPFLVVMGIAFLIATVSLTGFIRRKSIKTGILLSIGFIILGMGLFAFRIPSNQLIVVKVSLKKSPLTWPENEHSIPFSNQKLKIDPHNKSHAFNQEGRDDRPIALFWDGLIQTPFIHFKKGNYTVQFMAKGSKAENEYSKIKIETEIPDRNNYLSTPSVTYLTLTSKMEPVTAHFRMNTDAIGRIRITYFNDLYIPETHEGRDVWVKNVTISQSDK